MQTKVEISYASQYILDHRSAEKLKKEPKELLREKFPTKIPIIVERCRKERDLPDIGRKKFVIPQELTMSHFQSMMRKRINVGPTKAFFLLVNEKTMVSLSKTLLEVYQECRSEDGFLHITYASQDVFG